MPAATKTKVDDEQQESQEPDSPEQGQPERRFRSFINPQSPNSSYLIQPGEIVKTVDQNAPRGFREHARKDCDYGTCVKNDHDLYVRFVEGITNPVLDISTVDGQKQVAWCEANPGICRDVEHPETPVWASLKKGQIATSTKEAQFADVDVDAYLRGETSPGGGEEASLISAAVGQVREANARA